MTRKTHEGCPEAREADRQARGNQPAAKGQARRDSTPFFEKPDGKKALAIQEELVRTQYAADRRLGLQCSLVRGPRRHFTFISSPSPTMPPTSRRSPIPSHRVRSNAMPSDQVDPQEGP